MKTYISVGGAAARDDAGGLLLRGFLAEKGVDCLLRVGDLQPFLLRPRLTLLGLRLRFLGHFALLSHCQFQLVKVPQPGLEPGRPIRTRECKSRLSANSSTGAHISKLDVRAGSPSTSSPALTWFFRPSSAALPLLTSRSSFSPLQSLRDNRQ